MQNILILSWRKFYADGSGISRFDPLYFLAVRGIRRILDAFPGNEHCLELRFQENKIEICHAFQAWLAQNKEPWDLLIQAPSSAPYAAAFADAAGLIVANRINLRSERKVKAGDGRIDDDDILNGILPLDQDERTTVAEAKHVLVVDDVYAHGKTARAVERFLRRQGLAVESTVTIAVPLRVHGATLPDVHMAI